MTIVVIVNNIVLREYDICNGDYGGELVVFEKVAELIAEQFGIDPASISRKTSFSEDLNADSLDIVELTMMIEEGFDLSEIGDEALESLKTVGDVVALIQSRID